MAGTESNQPDTDPGPAQNPVPARVVPDHETRHNPVGQGLLMPGSRRKAPGTPPWMGQFTILWLF